MDCIGRGNKGEQLMGITVTVGFDWKCTDSRGNNYDIFMCHRPFGKHCLALASLAIVLHTYTRKHIVPTQTPAEHSAPSCRKTWPESQKTHVFWTAG